MSTSNIDQKVNAPDPMAPFKEAPDEIKTIIKKVLNFEKERLYQKRVRFNDEITKIIKEVIK